MKKEELLDKLKTLRAKELKECQEELESLLKKYKVSIGFDLVYNDGNLTTKIYLKDDSGIK